MGKESGLNGFGERLSLSTLLAILTLLSTLWASTPELPVALVRTMCPSVQPQRRDALGLEDELA